MPEPRGVRPEEFQEMADLVQLVFRSDLTQRVPLLYRHNDLENLRILKEDGKIVTHIGISTKDVSILGCQTRVGNIGSVCTHPDYQGRGFATLVLKDVMNKLRADGVPVMSVSGGRGLYLRAGCRRIGTHLNFSIDASALSDLPSLYPVDVVPYDEGEHLSQLASLYQSEAIRFWRPLEDFQTLFSIRNVLTVQTRQRCLAYIVTSIHQDEDTGAIKCHIGEFAGARLAILSAVKQLFMEHRLSTLSFGTSPYDTELVSILAAVGVSPTVSPLGNTTRIIDLPLLMEHFRPHLQQRLSTQVADQFRIGQKDGCHVFQFEDEQFLIGEEDQLVQMVFGTPDQAEQSIMPEDGKLSHILRSILPLPFVWPGINNV